MGFWTPLLHHYIYNSPNILEYSTIGSVLNNPATVKNLLAGRLTQKPLSSSYPQADASEGHNALTAKLICVVWLMHSCVAEGGKGTSMAVGNTLSLVML